MTRIRVIVFRVAVLAMAVAMSSLLAAQNLVGIDPLFVDPANGDFRLKPGSPAIGAGSPILDVDTDIDGKPRDLIRPTIGAYEGAYNDPAPPIVPPPPPPPSESTPFGGPAIPVPGRIEAEHFDEGGEGVAYHDTTAGNSGGAFRTSDVDLEPTTDTGGGYNVGWMNAGEWMLYSISVQSTGAYTLEARVASDQPGASFHVEIDGIDVTGRLAMPNTGGWQNWQFVTVTNISLLAGPHRVRFVVDADGTFGYAGNLNFLRFTVGTAPPPPPPALTLTVSPNLTRTAPTNAPMVVTYAAPVASGGVPPLQASCSPLSGSLFPIGKTTVLCTATDSASPQQIALASFDVTVLAPTTSNVCVSAPLFFDVTKWPAGTTGSRSMTYKTDRPARVTFDPLTTPWTAVAVDARGCSATDRK